MESTELANVSEKSLQLDHMSSRLTDSLFSKDLAPHYMKLAGQLASSELVPKSFRGKPADLFLCWALGYQIGMSPEQAMQCIAIINGRACMWGDELLALCMAHPDFQDIEEHPIRTADDAVIGYVCTVHRKGRKPKSSEFTLDMAKKAGLLAKGGVWNQYPERMLKLRARGFVLRDAFPDALKGIKSREEVEDYIEAEYIVSKPTRTAILKTDLKVKQGACHVAMDNETDSGIAVNATGIENECRGEASAPGEEQQPMDKAGEEAHQLHGKIKQLIEETGFTEERLKKALKFYKVESIDHLDLESANHFILKLTQ